MVGRSAVRRMAGPAAGGALRWLVAALLVLACAGLQASRSASSAYPWTDFDDLFAQLERRAGPDLQLYRLTLDHAGVATLWVQNARQPDFIDAYGYDEGELTGPDPVKFSHYPSLQDIERRLIPRAAVDFGRLPALAGLACDAANLPDASVDGIVLERERRDGDLSAGTPAWKFRLRAGAARADVYFDLGGRVLHAQRD